MNQDEFIAKAKKLWSGKIDYSLVDYKGSTVKVKLICPKHGVYSQTPFGHLQGKDCHKCAKARSNIFFWASKKHRV